MPPSANPIGLLLVDKLKAIVDHQIPAEKCTKQYDELTRFFSGIVGITKQPNAPYVFQTPSSVFSDISKTLKEKISDTTLAKKKFQCDFILHDEARQHFTLLIVVVDLSKTRPTVEIKLLDSKFPKTDDERHASENLFDPALKCIQEAVQTVLPCAQYLLIDNAVKYKGFSKQQKENTCGDRVLRRILSCYRENSRQQFPELFAEEENAVRACTDGLFAAARTAQDIATQQARSAATNAPTTRPVSQDSSISSAPIAGVDDLVDPDGAKRTEIFKRAFQLSMPANPITGTSAQATPFAATIKKILGGDTTLKSINFDDSINQHRLIFENTVAGASVSAQPKTETIIALRQQNANGTVAWRTNLDWKENCALIAAMQHRLHQENKATMQQAGQIPDAVRLGTLELTAVEKEQIVNFRGSPNDREAGKVKDTLTEKECHLINAFFATGFKEVRYTLQGMTQSQEVILTKAGWESLHAPPSPVKVLPMQPPSPSPGSVTPEVNTPRTSRSDPRN